MPRAALYSAGTGIAGILGSITGGLVRPNRAGDADRLHVMPGIAAGIASGPLFAQLRPNSN